VRTVPRAVVTTVGRGDAIAPDLLAGAGVEGNEAIELAVRKQGES
jgi:hypothetical protein